MQFKLYIADINYNIITPINLESGGIKSLSLKREVNQCRELKIQFNTHLDELYDYLLQSGSCLVLEIGGYKIGFSKDNNLVTDLVSYANTGTGSDFNNSILMNASVNLDTNYPVTTDNITDNQKQSYYIRNNAITTQRRYYKIKAFNFSNPQQSNNINEEKARQRLYNESVNYLDIQQNRQSISGQIKRQSGVVDLKFYSSSLDLATKQRTLAVNQDYQGNSEPLCQLIHPDFIFELVTNDVQITLNTGCYNNFELLNEIVKNRNLSWREIGLFNINGQNKTKIQIGNFDLLPVTNQANNLLYDDWFESNMIRIAKVTEYYPALVVDLDIRNFILEGERIQIEYKEYKENIDGTKREIFNINKIMSYKGSEIELYKLI